MVPFKKIIALALALAALTLALAACGGSGGTSASPSPSGPVTYTNDQYGFAITHDAQFSEGKPLEGSGTGGSSVFDVIFADKSGATVSDRYVDAIQVSVYELAREVKASDVPKLKSELDGVVEQMMGSLSTAKIVEPLSPITVNGVPGFGLKYTYTEAGTEMTAVTFFLVKGKYEYQITAQSATENWDSLKLKLEASAKSFEA